MSGNRTSFKTRLSVTLHVLTRNREIIDLMHKFFLGINYKDVVSLNDAWAKFVIETNRTCPEELAISMPGTAVMDNDDFKHGTLTGANTLHRTNVMFVQPQDLTNNMVDSHPPLSITSAKSMTDLCTAEHTACPYITDERGAPSIRPDVSIDAPYNTEIHCKRNVIHVLTRLDEDMMHMPTIY